jgi:septum formation protein
MLHAAGVPLEAIAANIDEESIKISLTQAGAKPRDIADALAEAKALKISRKMPAALVMGCDQICVGANGHIFDKPESPEDARAHLAQLSGTTHRLISAAVICEQGAPVWRVVDTAQMAMRPLSAAFIEHYVDLYWDHIRHSVGCYRIEAEGAQLFNSVSGSQFTVIGMPLLPVLDFLRLRGLIPT